MTTIRDSERLLIVAPLGRDAALTCDILERAGHEALACASISELCGELHSAGAVLITEEALASEEREQLFVALSGQPPWSDLPLIVFASAGAENSQRLEGLKTLGNATLVERPLAMRTLLSAVNAALRGRRRQYEARRAIEQRDQFLAMLGHELRNPLAAISLSVAVFERSEDIAAFRRHIGIVRRQSEHLSRLVDDLLDVSRITSGKVALSRAPLDVNESVVRCVSTLREPADKSGLTLTTTLAPTPAYVYGDAIRLEQVFTNLLSNAIKYTPSGGNVHAEVSMDDDQVVVRVLDTGVGMKPEALSVIFDLFAQVPGSLDRARGGLGIGLTLVRSIVLLHGGTVEAKSEGCGAGSELIVRLPRTEAPTEVREISAPSLRAPAEPRRPIVVVDDSVDVRESLKEFLELLGHPVATAVDGPSGLERIIDIEPLVALVDIGLPGLDGYEVARRAREALGDRVQLCAITGYGQPADKEAARVAGFNQHFTKPIDLRRLEILLHDAALG